MANICRGGLAFPCRMPVYMWLHMVWLYRHHDRSRVNFASPQVDRVGQIISESKFPPFIGCCRFLVLQIRVVSCPCSPISMQLEPIDYKNNVDSSTLLNI